MKTTLILNEELINKAILATGIKVKTALIHLGLEELIKKAARERLIKLGGTMKNAKAPRRRRD